MRCAGLRAAGVRVVCSTTVAVASASGLPATAGPVLEPLAADVDAAVTPTPGEPPAAADGPEPVDEGPPAMFRFVDRPAEGDLERALRRRFANGVGAWELAQFQLPPAPAEGGAPEAQLQRELTYQYAYGSESQIVYRRNADLNSAGVSDNVTLVAPQVNGIVVYRPNNWLVATLEMIAEVEIPVQQAETVTLPNGTTRPDLPTNSQLLVDQAFVTIRNVIAPFEFNIGRRNYEDERHWLYDTSIDIVSLTYREGPFRVEGFAGREAFKSWNLWPNAIQVKDRISTSLLYFEYRGIEDLRLAAYTIARNDLTRNEGRPRLWGVRALGSPTVELNFWTEIAYLGGRDPLNKRYQGNGYDVGLTYRFPDLPWTPNITVGYAFGSGDSGQNRDRNQTFRQTGLQSNEQRWAGVAKFKYYGEVLEPELSNIGILSLGIGARPVPTVSIDLVYHTYRLDKIADDVAGSPITAQMAQFDPLLSKRVGSELDLILGFREVFGVRRLGVDLRMGWFFPGAAFIRNDGTDDEPLLRKADKGFSLVAKFWW